MGRIRGLDFAAPGRQLGFLDLTHSDNRHDNGVIPVPVAMIAGEPGPTALLIAGTHGDEYEGQVVLQRLLRELSPDLVRGRLIIVPAINLPAVRTAGRVSPLDGGNLNRSYPGERRGGPTQQLAHLVSTELLPLADYALDLHSGGTASTYLPSAFVYDDSDPVRLAAKREAAQALGLPWSFLVPERFEPHSFSTASDDAGVCMVATELAGGGGLTRDAVQYADAGVRRVLALWGLLPQADGDAEPTRETRWLRLDERSAVTTPARGLFEAVAALGEAVEAGQVIGWVHPVEELDRPSVPVSTTHAGVISVVRRPPLVEHGDHLFQLAFQL